MTLLSKINGLSEVFVLGALLQEHAIGICMQGVLDREATENKWLCTHRILAQGRCMADAYGCNCCILKRLHGYVLCGQGCKDRTPSGD